MQHDEAIVEFVIALNDPSNLVPAGSIDAAAVEQTFELQDAIAYEPRVLADRRP